MTHHVYKHDLPDGLNLGPVVAIDCETMGLLPQRDRLCVVQLSAGDGNAFGATAQPVYCTKIASRLVRTYTDRHGLAILLKELLGIDISKQQQSSDWGAETLTDAQIDYAASDVLYLHRLRDALNTMLEREGRAGLARECSAVIPTIARLDEGFLQRDLDGRSYSPGRPLLSEGRSHGRARHSQEDLF